MAGRTNAQTDQGSSPLSHRLIAVLAVTLTLAGVMLVLDRWNAATTPVFAVRPHPVVPEFLLHEHHQPSLDIEVSVPWGSPLFAVGDVMIRLFGRNYLAIMRTQYVFLALFAAGLAAIAWRHGGPFAGAVGGIAGAIAPVGWIAALAMDDHLFNMTLVVWAAYAVMRSEGLSKPVWTALAGLLCGLCYRWSFLDSNAVLAFAVVASAAAGSVLESRYDRRGLFRSGGGAWRTGDARRWILALLVFAVALGIGGFWNSSRIGLQLNYFTHEIDKGRPIARTWWFWALTAYAYIAVGYQVGPVGVVFSIAGLVRWMRLRAPDRWLALGWVAAVPVVLSVIPKKNTYYAFYAWSATPVLIAFAVSGARTRTRRVLLATVALGGSLAWSWWQMQTPGGVGPDSHYDHFFQGSTHYYLMSPEPHQGIVDDAEHLVETLKARRPQGARILVILLNTLERAERLRFGMLLADPDAQLHVLGQSSNPPPDDTEPFYAANVADPPPPLSDIVAEAMGDSARDTKPLSISRPGEDYLARLYRRAGEYVPIARVGYSVIYDRAANQPTGGDAAPGVAAP